MFLIKFYVLSLYNGVCIDTQYQYTTFDKRLSYDKTVNNIFLFILTFWVI